MAAVPRLERGRVRPREQDGGRREDEDEGARYER